MPRRLLVPTGPECYRYETGGRRDRRRCISVRTGIQTGSARRQSCLRCCGCKAGEGIMPEHSSEELLAVFDRCPLHARYWAIFGLVSAVAALDFFDFFSVGF